ncbi:hypothetical protein B0H15DRAFT_927200 [Mycena belliarum]|uniref:Uncharacterized protein n=1 Tax=Mycena belliarum TaxID=1033014 RepID=A0AAD6UF91_9AGAR|nr:hypothetical protein B0H15DRAFT_927200 [Mycena belliae]
MLGLRITGALTLLRARYGAQPALKFFESSKLSVLGGDDVFKLNMEPGKGALTFGYQVFISTMQKCSIMLQQLQIQSGGGTSVSYDNKTQRFKAQYDVGPHPCHIYPAESQQIRYPFWKYTTFAGDTAEIFARATLSFAFSSQLVLQHVEVAVSSNAELTLNVAMRSRERDYHVCARSTINKVKRAANGRVTPPTTHFSVPGIEMELSSGPPPTEVIDAPEAGGNLEIAPAADSDSDSESFGHLGALDIVLFESDSKDGDGNVEELEPKPTSSRSTNITDPD